ncbi:MAG: Transcriptional regulator, AcrR family, partial [uncultured Rubrobacteraceae bacterium]
AEGHRRPPGRPPRRDPRRRPTRVRPQGLPRIVHRGDHRRVGPLSRGNLQLLRGQARALSRGGRAHPRRADLADRRRRRRAATIAGRVDPVCLGQHAGAADLDHGAPDLGRGRGGAGDAQGRRARVRAARSDAPRRADRVGFRQPRTRRRGPGGLGGASDSRLDLHRARVHGAANDHERLRRGCLPGRSRRRVPRM